MRPESENKESSRNTLKNHGGACVYEGYKLWEYGIRGRQIMRKREKEKKRRGGKVWQEGYIMYVYGTDTYAIAFGNNFAEIARREFVESVVVSENDDGNFYLTENRQFIGLFEETGFSFEKGARS